MTPEVQMFEALLDANLKAAREGDREAQAWLKSLGRIREKLAGYAEFS